MTKKTYGTLRLQGKKWILEAEPHVLMRAKRIFQKIDKSSIEKVELSDTPENARELEWLLERYPMEMDTYTTGYLKFQARQFKEHILRMSQIIDGHYQPRKFDMALPPRDYQVVAANIYLGQKHLLLADTLGLGKAQPVDCKVLTPDGWRNIGDLKVGDQICDPSGGFAKVTGVFPQGTRPVFDFIAGDGGKTRCCEQHLWHLFTQHDRNRSSVKKGRVLALKDFRGHLSDSYYRDHPNWKTSKYFLPISEPVEPLHPKEPLLSPWLVGVLIGNGGLTRCVMFSSNDEETLERVRRELKGTGCSMIRANGDYDYRIKRDADSGSNPIQDLLSAMGIHGHLSIGKALPKAWTSWSVKNKMLLLNGLMDTDGDCNSGVAIFNTSSPQLATDVRELVRSLGGIANITKRANPKYVHNGEVRIGQPAYRVNVRLQVNPFSLSRKAKIWTMPYLARAVKSVVPAGDAECVCIRVDSKNSTYITDDWIVTHNTASAITSFCEPRTLPACVVVPPFLKMQWESQIRKFMPQLKVHIIKKRENYPIPRGTDVVLCGYAMLNAWAGPLSQYCRSFVADECQELRRDESDKYKAAKFICDRLQYKYFLSASPVYNYGGEMFNVMNCMQDGCLGDREEFIREWCTVEDGFNGSRKVIVRDPIQFGDYLKENFLMLRRTREEVGKELPEVVEVVEIIESSTEVLNRIKGRAAELARIILSNSGHQAGDKMNAAGQLDNLVRQQTGIAKAPYVAEFVKMLVETGEKILLLCWHRAVYDILMERFHAMGIKATLFTGSESASQKELAKRSFVEGETQVLLMSLRSGIGVDGLQEVCKVVCFAELDWAAGVQQQCIGRLHRDGQRDNVTAYFLCANDGSDPLMMDVLGFKGAQIAGINDGKESLVLGRRDTDNVRRLAEKYLRMAHA